MRFLRHRAAHRRMEPDRRPFALFVVGTVAVLGLVFVIGLQTGRYVERRAASAEPTSARPERRAAAQENGAPSPQAAIRRDLNAFSEEASQVPAAAPQAAKEELARTERETTFRKTLAGPEATAVPLSPRAEADDRGRGPAAEAARKKVYTVQAGAFRDRKAAESVRAKIARSGIAARVLKPSGGREKGRYYRVVVGPFSDREEAARTMGKIRSEMKIVAVVVAGQAP